MDSSADFELVGVLKGHKDWVTAISTPNDLDINTVISSSRDKTLLVWKVNPDLGNLSFEGKAVKSLTGHSQCVQDVAISNDGLFALSGSWDTTLRLWDLNLGTKVRSFDGHTNDVMSVAFSADNRQILSAGKDKTIKMWNTMANCKFTITEDQHTDWISCVRFSPVVNKQPLIMSCGWDSVVKVWNMEKVKLQKQLERHTAPLYTLTISPDGSLCASGGRDGFANLWNLEGLHLYSLQSDTVINSLCFSPCKYWLCAGTKDNIIIWDLEKKKIICKLTLPSNEKDPINSPVLPCTCINWSIDGKTLYAGATNGKIYVFRASSSY